MKTTALFSALCLSLLALSGCGENPHVDLATQASAAPSGAANNSLNPPAPTPDPAPAPAPTPVPVPVSFGMVNFDFDSAVVKSKYNNLLGSVIDYLRQNPSATIVLQGNASDDGSESYNENLSERRGNAVLDFLVRGGISKDRISVVPRGEDHPIVDPTHQPTPADLEAAREQNRRVELVITK